jgi:hypothetical protein
VSSVSIEGRGGGENSQPKTIHGATEKSISRFRLLAQRFRSVDDKFLTTSILNLAGDLSKCCSAQKNKWPRAGTHADADASILFFSWAALPVARCATALERPRSIAAVVAR